MASSIAKFGELAIRPSSLDLNDEDDGGSGSGIGNNETDNFSNGFATIDLNGSNSPVDTHKQPSIKSNFTNNSSLGYTSFGEAIFEPGGGAHLPAKFSTAQYKISNNNTVTTILNNNNSSNINGNMDASNIDGNYSKMNSLPTSLSNASGISMLTTASDASSKLALKTVSTIEMMKCWTKSAYKCTKQIVNEKLGKTNRTVDPELDASIENLRELKKKYENILALSKNLTSQFCNVLTTQKTLAESFAELAQKSPDLNEEFTSNSEIQRSLIKHGETLINGIRTFTSNLNTLCSKTIEDTLITIRNYEAARLEYDANRSEIEQLQTMQTPADKNPQQLNQLESELTNFKEKYEKLRKDVMIKIKFLDENRVKVMRKQLSLFQTAVSSYFAGNQQALESTLDQINSKSSAKLFKNESSNEDGEYKFESFLEEA